MMIIFWLGAAFLVYYLYQKGSLKTSAGKNPEALLKERFVNGEIDEATYLQMKETLKD
mgnify:CR=1 FL=1